MKPSLYDCWSSMFTIFALNSVLFWAWVFTRDSSLTVCPEESFVLFLFNLCIGALSPSIHSIDLTSSKVFFFNFLFLFLNRGFSFLFIRMFSLIISLSAGCNSTLLGLLKHTELTN